MVNILLMFDLMGAASADNLVHYEERMLSSKCTHIKCVLNIEYSINCKFIDLFHYVLCGSVKMKSTR